MAGTALVTIGENQWNVEIATTVSELTTGLSGRASLAAGTGMLFVLPARQVVAVQTNGMLFPLDIIFIKDNLVLSMAQSIEPGLLVEEATPCDGFLEVNAGEMFLVEVGDSVVVETTTPPSGFNISSIITFAIPVAILGFVFGMVGGGSSPKKQPSRNKHDKETVKAVKYYTIVSPGQTVFHIGDVVSRITLEKENRRVRALGENEATFQLGGF